MLLHAAFVRGAICTHRLEEARMQFSQAVELDPSHADAHYNYAIYLHMHAKVSW
jgi:hypothetical protein